MLPISAISGHFNEDFKGEVREQDRDDVVLAPTLVALVSWKCKRRKKLPLELC